MKFKVLKESGYYGYSMLNNAVAAYEDGEKPLSKWSRADILDTAKDINPSKYELIKKLPLSVLKRVVTI